MENKYNLTLEQNIFLAKRNIIDNIYAGARMEEINVTFLQVKKILEGINVPNLKIDEIQCILNLRDAWKYVINNIKEEFNINFICKINELVARRESIEWGVLRSGNVQITGTEYISDVPEEEVVKKQIAEILKIKNTTERAIEYMLYGMRSQLFWDGNKRTSMICANKIMIENGNGIIKVPDNKLEEFNTLLSEFYTSNDKVKIKQFIFANCIDGITFKE
jgi:filamentation induced by cAMP protein fic